jgi:hypothetical protein
MRYGDSVILSLPNGTMKMIELKQGGCVPTVAEKAPSSADCRSHALPTSCSKSVSLGKYGSFPPSALEGQLYGVTYTIQDPAAEDVESAGAKATLVPLRGEGLAQVGAYSLPRHARAVRSLTDAPAPDRQRTRMRPTSSLATRTAQLKRSRWTRSRR